MSKTKLWSPYPAGSRIVLRHRCGDHPEGHVAELVVRRSEFVHEHDPGNFKWWTFVELCDGTPAKVRVDHRGFDQFDRVQGPPIDFEADAAAVTQ